MKRNSKAQSMVEYAVLVAVIAVALIAMKIYFTRSMQQKYRETADVFGEGEQYEKGVTKEAAFDGGTLGKIDPAGDPCGLVNTKVTQLQNDINNLQKQADTFGRLAGDRQNTNWDAKAGKKKEKTTVTTYSLKDGAGVLQEQADTYKGDIKTVQDKINNLKQDYPQCFK